MYSNLAFSYNVCAFGIITIKTSVEIFFSVFSSQSFIVLALWSLVHFESIFVYSVKARIVFKEELFNSTKF